MKNKEKRILQESDDEETPAGASSTVLEMPVSSGEMQQSESPDNAGMSAENVVSIEKRGVPEIQFGATVHSSDEEEVVTTPAPEKTKNRKRKDRSSGGVADRKAKAAKTGVLPEEVVEVELQELNQGALVVAGAVEKADVALNTKFISFCMSQAEAFDRRLENPSRALDAIAIWIQHFEKDASKWHLLKDKDARTKLKWSKVVDLYFGGDRNGEEGQKWFVRFFQDKNTKMSTELSRMSDVIGRVFSKAVYRPYGFAYLLKLAEAMGQKQVDLLDPSIWEEAQQVMRRDWEIWCQRISIREEYRGLYIYSISGCNAQDTGEEYLSRKAGLEDFKARVQDSLVKLSSSSVGTPSSRPKPKKRAITVEAVSSGVTLARAPVADVAPVSVELTSVSAPTATSTGDVRFRVPGWTPYVPNEDDDIKWRKEAAELSRSELDSALATVEAQGVTGAKDRKDIQRMLCEKIDEVSMLEAKFQVYRKVQETAKANKRVCKRVGNLFGEQNAADAVNEMIKSFLDYYEGKVPDLREAAASVAQNYNTEISQRLKSGSGSTVVPMDSISQLSQVASTSSATAFSAPVPVTARIEEFTPESVSTTSKSASQPFFSHGTGSGDLTNTSASDEDDIVTSPEGNDDDEDEDDVDTPDEEHDALPVTEKVGGTQAGDSADSPANETVPDPVIESVVVGNKSQNTVEREAEAGSSQVVISSENEENKRDVATVPDDAKSVEKEAHAMKDPEVGTTPIGGGEHKEKEKDPVIEDGTSSGEKNDAAEVDDVSAGEK